MGTLFGESLENWYRATILMLCYGFGELGHYILGVVSKPMAQDIQFGTIACVSLDEDVEKYADVRCVDLKNESTCNNITLNGTNYCIWDYSGQGIEYQVLAGPIFTAIFTVFTLINGMLGDKYNRIHILSFAVLWYSVMTFSTGFADTYWLVALLRSAYGAGESACTPLTASIVADTFSNKNRGFAMGYFNWGIYFGYGLAFAIGNYVTEADILGTGWRFCYFLAGGPGIIMAIILFLTVKEPARVAINASDKAEQSNDPILTKFAKSLKMLVTSPVILLLLVGACFRHSASFCWSYNSQAYFSQYYPGTEIGLYMALCSIIGGSFGIVSGGWISDILAKKYGIQTRIWVLAGSQIIAAGLACGVLAVEPPYSFLFLLFAYLFAEMWFGVLFTILVEFFPSAYRSTAVGIFIFVINNIGGNAPLLVTPLREALGLRNALFVVYPGFYAASSFFFLLTQLAYLRYASRGEGNFTKGTQISDDSKSGYVDYKPSSNNEGIKEEKM